MTTIEKNNVNEIGDITVVTVNMHWLVGELFQFCVGFSEQKVSCKHVLLTFVDVSCNTQSRLGVLLTQCLHLIHLRDDSDTSETSCLN